MSKPTVLVSACLMGQRVRHDGQDKKDRWIKDELSKWVNFDELCPEMAMGLGAPRETISLHLVNEKVKLLSNKHKVDLTQTAKDVSNRLLDQSSNWDGAILKKDSPSCGIERVRLYRPTGIPQRDGVGMFAKAVLDHCPSLPMIHEGRLTDLIQREAFVLQIFARHRLRQTPRATSALQKFHQSYKLILMAHSPAHYQKLGRLAANSKKENIKKVFVKYESLFFEALRLPAPPKRRINVLQHMMGYLKRDLNAKDKERLNRQIEDYAKGVVPLVVPLEMIRFLVNQFEVDYLKDQLVFDPYPKELKLMKAL